MPLVNGSYVTDEEMRERNRPRSSGPPYDYEPDNPRGTGLEPPGSQWNPGTGQWDYRPGGSGIPIPAAHTTTVTASAGGGGSRSVPGVPQDWLDDFIRRNPLDYDRARAAYESNNLSKTNIPGTEYDTDPSKGKLPPFGFPMGTVPGQFTDPIAKYIEDFAQKHAQRLETPPAGSGQAELERVLRSIGAQFEQGGFTPGEQEIFQTQALDPLERLRTSRKQQVMQNLSARGIAPGSGVAIQLLQDVDRQFDAMRAQQQRSIAGQAAQERQSRLLQAVQLMSGLAGTEGQRLQESFGYRTVPLNLADRAFNQAFQLYGSAGNPLALIPGLAGLGGMQQGRSDAQLKALADLLFALTRGQSN